MTGLTLCVSKQGAYCSPGTGSDQTSIRTVPVARVPWDDPCITPELMCRVLEARAAAAALPRPLREPFLVTIERP